MAASIIRCRVLLGTGAILTCYDTRPKNLLTPGALAIEAVGGRATFVAADLVPVG
jgi:hypothetical protein